MEDFHLGTKSIACHLIFNFSLTLMFSDKNGIKPQNPSGRSFLRVQVLLTGCGDQNRFGRQTGCLVRDLEKL